MRGWKRDTVNILRKTGLKKRLFISFLLISILPMGLVGTFMGRRLYHTIMDNYEAQSVQTLNTLEYRITEKLNQDAKMVNDYASSLDVVKSVTKFNRKTDTFDRTILIKGMQTSLLSDLNQGQTGMRSEILDKNGEYATGIFEDNYQPAVAEARKMTVEGEERLQITHIENKGAWDTQHQTIVYSRQVINYFSGNIAGWVLMYRDTSALKQEMEKIRSDALMVIYDDNGEVVCFLGKQEPYGPEKEKDIRAAGLMVSQYGDKAATWKSDWKIKGEKYQLLFCKLDAANFHIAIFQNYRELRQSFAEVGLLLLILVPLSLGAILFMSYLMTSTVAEPVGNIVRQMQLFSSGKPDARVEDTSEDEIGVLGQEFNAMIGNIERLTEEVYESRIKEKEASLRALEAQINPHFLYNTLDMINWMSFRSSNRDICKIVRTLSEFFRLSLNNGKELYTIRDEMKHVNSYITIEQYKMSEISFRLFMEERLATCVCPKLIVQPLVENAIRHGIEAGKGYGNIEVEFVQEYDTIIIRVTDDGVGLKGKNETGVKYHQGGYGIQNINERLKMLYGKEYRVTITERAEGGVISQIKIPKIESGGCTNADNDS